MHLHLVQHQQVSKNAEKLSEQLVEVIRAAKKSNKNLSYGDVYQATQLTSSKMREELGGTVSRTQTWIVIGSLLALMAAAIAFAILAR